MNGGRFDRAQARLHRVADSKLSDAIGVFHPQGGRPVPDLPLQVDRNLSYEGEDGARLMTRAVGLTWMCFHLKSAAKGDKFVIGAERFQVDEIIADDGHSITAATTKL